MASDPSKCRWCGDGTHRSHPPHVYCEAAYRAGLEAASGHLDDWASRKRQGEAEKLHLYAHQIRALKDNPNA